MDEARRHRLHELLADAIGREAADELLRHLPPHEWAEIMTRTEFDARFTALEARLEGMHAEQRSAITELRGEMKSDIAALRTELKDDIAALRTELKDDIAALRGIVARQAWIMTVGVITATSGAVAATAILT